MKTPNEDGRSGSGKVWAYQLQGISYFWIILSEEMRLGHVVLMNYKGDISISGHTGFPGDTYAFYGGLYREV